MKKTRLLSVVAAGVAALALPVSAATTASAYGKASIYDCWSNTMSSDRHTATTVCNPPGSYYRFAVQCSWYSAGQGGSYWKYSAWTKDGYRASVSCGSACVTAFGATVHYE